MHALGISTTRALAAVSSGEPVYRQGAEHGAVFTRVAQSNIRMGTFQFFCLRNDKKAVTLLADHVLKRHYSDIDNWNPDDYIEMCRALWRRQEEVIRRCTNDRFADD